MKKIVIDHGQRKELMRVLKTTYPTIKKALNFETNTPLSQKIRKAALNRGGSLLEQKTDNKEIS